MGPDHQPVTRQVAKITIYVAGSRHEDPPAIGAAWARPVHGHEPADSVLGSDSDPA